METQRSHASGFSAIRITAILSIVVLVGAAGWQGYQTYLRDSTPDYVAPVAKGNENTARVATLPNTATVGSSAIGAAVLDDLTSRYNTLKSKGLYSPETAQKAAEEMASTLMPEVLFTHHTTPEVLTDPVTSSDRALAYRHDLQESLKPLLENKQAEFEIFAYYTDTKDPKYLMQLRQVAANYRAAALATTHVVVPKDAVDEHVGILNALEQFAATLEAQVTSANDPLATVALLRTYNHAEAEVFTSFNTLATYFKKKTV